METFLFFAVDKITKERTDVVRLTIRKTESSTERLSFYYISVTKHSGPSLFAKDVSTLFISKGNTAKFLYKSVRLWQEIESAVLEGVDCSDNLYRAVGYVSSDPPIEVDNLHRAIMIFRDQLIRLL